MLTLPLAYLKFQKILALSSGDGWRPRDLLAAANLTGLQVDIPIHPNAVDELAEAFADIGSEYVKHPGKGQAAAWLAHLDLIRYSIAADLESVLILENDVDWDLAIKDQMRLVSQAVRNFTNVQDTTPYGSNWDVLWIGHCGDTLRADVPRIEFNDTTSGRPPHWTQYHGWTRDGLSLIHDGHRVLQKSFGPVCSFGYAVNRYTAQKVLARASKGQDEAFDIVLNTACGNGELNCLTVNPEVMHHYDPPQGFVNDIGKANGIAEEHTAENLEDQMGATVNIVNSARCAARFHKTCVPPPPVIEEEIPTMELQR